MGDVVERVTRKNQDLVSQLPLTISAQYGLIDQNMFFDKRVASKDVSGYYLIYNGEFAYNKSTSSDAPWGAIKRLDRYENGVLSTLYIVFKIKNEEVINSDFLVTYYDTCNWHKDIKAVAAEGARNHGLLNIAPADFFKTELMLPQDIEEQKKIGSYFKLIDHLITLHQRKYLQEKKTSLTWEQRKLEDVMDTVSDYVAAGSFEDIRNNVTYLNEPGYAQLVRTVDLKKKFTNNDSVYVDESAFKYLWRVNLNDECIVLPNIGANIGEVYFVEPSGLPYDNNVLGPNAILLKANEDTYFAFTALNNLTFQKQLFENVGSSGQPKFNKTELKSIQLYMPQNEEQVKIGQYFRQLDHIITLHRRAHFHRRRRTYK